MQVVSYRPASPQPRSGPRRTSRAFKSEVPDGLEQRLHLSAQVLGGVVPHVVTVEVGVLFTPADDPISQMDASLGGVVSFLAAPAIGDLNGRNGGTVLYFQYGTIYWPLSTGAREVHGAILDE